MISREVLGADGGPLVQRPVRLASEPGGGETALAVLTLGLTCTTEVCADAVRSGETDAAGRYRLELTGKETQTTFGHVRQQVLSTAAAPGASEVSGPAASARFVVQTEQLALPALRLVDPALELGSAPGREGASWETAVAGLTDGDLFLTDPPPSLCPELPAGSTAAPAGCAPSTSVTLALPATARAEFVVVRGCAETCAVEATTDARSLRRAGAVTGAFGTVALPGDGVRAVRVGLARDGLREVSVWGPSSTEPALQPVARDAVEQLRQPYETADDDAVPTAVIVLAGVLCAAGVLGVGYLLGRRRS